MTRDWILWKLTQACWLLYLAIVLGLLFWMHTSGFTNLELLILVPIAVGGAFLTAWIQRAIGAPPGGPR